MRAIISIVFLSFFFTKISGQDSVSQEVHTISGKDLKRLYSKTNQIAASIDKKSIKYLSRLEKREKKLYKYLSTKNKELASLLFIDIDKKYEQLKIEKDQKLNLRIYSPHLDSLTIAVNFLQNQYTSQSSEIASEVKSIKSSLAQAERIKEYISERNKVLASYFENLGMTKKLRAFQKDIYYYKAQIRESKKLLESPSKAEKKLLQLAMQSKQFKNFFAEHSEYAKLFTVYRDDRPTFSVNGLQTRGSVSQMFQNRFGNSPAIRSQLLQNVKSAEGIVNSSLNNLLNFKSGDIENGNAEMPKNFKPNSQKTKTFFQRITLGANMQSQKSNYYFPITTDLGLSAAYNLNDKSAFGLGVSYKVGLGSGFDNIKLTHQGIGVRSSIEYKVKAFYLVGGYEINYRSLINSLSQLHDYSSWQKSGLIGLSKKYKVSKKLNGNVQLVWDFLSYQQFPQTQPIIFRIGYSIK